MILITAAGGKVGRHVVAQLAQKKVPARAGFHTQAAASAIRDGGIDPVVIDFENPESVAAAFRGIDTLFLVTPGSPDQGRHEELLLAEAKKVGIKRIVKLSGKPADHVTVGFARWNREAEERIKKTDVPSTILRANYFMQNLFGNAEQIKKGAFTNGPAGKRIALVDARDIAAMAVAALTEEGHAGKTYEVNGPERLDGYQQAAAISSALARTVAYVDVSAADFAAQLKSFGLPSWLIDAFSAAAADTSDPGPQSSADVERVLHRKPGTLAQFVKENSAAFQPQESRG